MHAPSPMKVVIIATLMLAVAPTGHAEVYKWVDEKGRVHYGDRPLGESAKKVDIKPTPSDPANAASEARRREQRDRLLEAFEEERKEKKEAERVAREERAKKDELCTRVDKELTELGRGGRFYIQRKDGARDYLDEQAVAERIKKLEAASKKTCR